MKNNIIKVTLRSNGPKPYELNKIYECEIIITNAKYIVLYHIPCPDSDANANKDKWIYKRTFSKYYFKKYFMTISELRKEKLEKINENR